MIPASQGVSPEHRSDHSLRVEPLFWSAITDVARGCPSAKKGIVRGTIGLPFSWVQVFIDGDLLNEENALTVFSLGVTSVVEDLLHEEIFFPTFCWMIICAEEKKAGWEGWNTPFPEESPSIAGVFQDLHGAPPSVKEDFLRGRAPGICARVEDHFCEKLFFNRMRVKVFFQKVSKTTPNEGDVFIPKIIITKKRRRDSSVEDLFRGWPKDRAESQIHCYCGGISNKEKPPWQRPTTPSTTPSP
ncbi:hypothetical protein KQI84_14370 [bacterium]|nr:hypothetical protein [bacterium]